MLGLENLGGDAEANVAGLLDTAVSLDVAVEDDEEDGTGTGRGKDKKKAAKKGKKKDKAWQRGKRYEIDYGGDEMDVDDQAVERAVQARRDEMMGDAATDDGSAAGVENDMSGPMPIKPTTDSPMWNFMYGQMMLTARSHHTSLCKFNLLMQCRLFEGM